jgi:two-component system, NarL family, sensor kinase
MNATEKLRRRNRELSILNTVARDLNRALDLEATLSTALQHVAELLDLETGWIWLLDEEAGDYYLAAQQSLPPALTEHPERMAGSAYCYCLDTYKSGDLEGAANVNVVTCSRLWGLVESTDGLRYHASIPLYAHGKKLGMLNVASGAWKKLSAEELDLLHTLGDLLAIAVERARLFARSAELGAVEERSRLARELHDTVAQRLTGVALQLESADALLQAGAERVRVQASVQRALGLTRASLEEARQAVQDLRAVPLQGRSLAEALAELVDEARRAGPLEVELSVRGARPLGPRLEVGLYRIAQEALANVARHASARRAAVLLELSPERIGLVVEDDGRGFEPGRVASGRFGLVGLGERARLLGGSLRIESEPGRGTRVSVTIPTGPEART